MDGLVLYDDGGGEFGPMLDLRSSYDLRTGIFTTAERFERRSGLSICARISRPGLEAFDQEKVPGTTVADLPEDGVWGVLNGRWIDAQVPTEPGVELDAEEGVVRAGILTTAQLCDWVGSGNQVPEVATRRGTGSPLLRYPWDLLSSAIVQIESDVAFLAESASTTDLEIIGSHRVYVGRNVKVDPGVMLDATGGPVVIGDDVSIGANSVIDGPVAIGAGSMVHPLTRLKPCNVIGPDCKLGGEVGASVFQGFSNKAHDGFLGDSWVGKWVNLGAGTTGSNLKNTYDNVKVQLEPNGPRFDTGRSFFGAVIGDHVKTAIGTRLMTGTVLGTGSMIACSTPPPLCTRRFSWLTDKEPTTYSMAKFMSVAEDIMARRGVRAFPAYLARIAQLHELQG